MVVPRRYCVALESLTCGRQFTQLCQNRTGVQPCVRQNRWLSCCGETVLVVRSLNKPDWQATSRSIGLAKTGQTSRSTDTWGMNPPRGGRRSSILGKRRKSFHALQRPGSSLAEARSSASLRAMRIASLIAAHLYNVTRRPKQYLSTRHRKI